MISLRTETQNLGIILALACSFTTFDARCGAGESESESESSATCRRYRLS
jgi:hypothetical protein